jgi:Kef-type K+ transport system membrane component KefB
MFEGRRKLCIRVALGAVVLSSAPALASGAESDPIASVVLGLALILFSAKVGGDLATRIGQPSVLGELLVGVVLGNLGLFGFHAFEPLKTDAMIDLLARLGVIVLLFEVGLESTVSQMLKVGASSFLVASLGVAAPFALGWGVGAWLLPTHSVYVHAFLGAALSATSVGITARVLKDLGKSQTTEARIILGAAVIDDVMGLVILAVVAGVIAAADAGEAVSYAQFGFTLFKATAFLVGSLVLGLWVSPRLFKFASRLRASGVLLAIALSFCFFLAWLASAIGLAPIVGAFAAGLILEDTHYEELRHKEKLTLEELTKPIGQFLIPIFFVLMGARVELASFAQPGVPALAAGLIAAAIIGKQLCAFGVIGKGIDRLSIGIGMIPRGEVGLIFANLGLTLQVKGEHIIDASTYAAVVLMVVVTTMVTPPALKWSLGRAR